MKRHQKKARSVRYIDVGGKRIRIESKNADRESIRKISNWVILVFFCIGMIGSSLYFFQLDYDPNKRQAILPLPRAHPGDSTYIYEGKDHIVFIKPNF